MDVLLKNVFVVDAGADKPKPKCDILIQNGKIIRIDADITPPPNATIIDGHKEEPLFVSTGWVDTFAHVGEPGGEANETFETFSNAAVAGGFTHVFALPNTNPVVDNKATLSYIINCAKQLPLHILPIGTITKSLAGKELAEMYDMYNSGAIAFSDGWYPVVAPNLLLKALQYVKAFDGVLLQMPTANNINPNGVMHEGVTSVQLGLSGIPSMAEEITIYQHLQLLRYADSRLHISGVSTAKGLALINAAKQEGLDITCSVTPLHLLFCDEDLELYNTNLKLNPPLRSTEDREGLRQGVINGTVDCIASHHKPHNIDDKLCEFEYAVYGAINLQTSFAVINTLFPQLSELRLVQLLSNNARKIFNLPQSAVTVGSDADLTIFSRNEKFLFTNKTNKSKSSNTPLFNYPLLGKVHGIISKGYLHLGT